MNILELQVKLMEAKKARFMNRTIPTQAEREIIAVAKDGATSLEISEMLGKTIHTVCWHLGVIHKKGLIELRKSGGIYQYYHVPASGS